MMDLNEENPRALELRVSRGFNLASFNPHGISTFIDSGKNWWATNIKKKQQWFANNWKIDLDHICIREQLTHELFLYPSYK